MSPGALVVGESLIDEVVVTHLHTAIGNDADGEAVGTAAARAAAITVSRPGADLPFLGDLQTDPQQEGESLCQAPTTTT